MPPITIAATRNSIPGYTYDDGNNRLDSCTFSSLKPGDNIVITLQGRFIDNISSDVINAYVFNNILTTTTPDFMTNKVSFNQFNIDSAVAQDSLTSTDVNIKINEVGTYYLYTTYSNPSINSNTPTISKDYVLFNITNNTAAAQSYITTSNGTIIGTSDIRKYLAQLNTNPDYSTTGVNTTKEFIKSAIDDGITFTQAQKDIITKYSKYLADADKAREIVDQVYNLIRLTDLAKYAAAADVDNALKEARNAALNFYIITNKTTLNSDAFTILSNIVDSSSFSINNLTLVLEDLDEILVYAINYAESKGLNRFDSTAIANSAAITKLNDVIGLAINLPTRVN